MSDIDVSHLSLDCGKWRIGFDWSEMDEYKSSVSHGNSESADLKVSTDTLIMTASADRSKVIKVSVIMYPTSSEGLVGFPEMMAAANETLIKSGVCGNISIAPREIDGSRGVFARGEKCPRGEEVYASVYPVSYHLDRPGGILAASALGVILSTYDQERTERFVNSLKIEQMN